MNAGTILVVFVLTSVKTLRGPSSAAAPLASSWQMMGEIVMVISYLIFLRAFILQDADTCHLAHIRGNLLILPPCRFERV